MRISTLTIAVVLLCSPLAARAQDPSLQPPPELIPAPRPPAPEKGAAETATVGSIDLGFRGTTTSGDAARYERYRDLQSGAWSRLLFEKSSDQYLFGASAQNIGYRDQDFAANYRRGRATFTGLFQSIPLNYSYITSTPWVEQSPGILTLDSFARTAVQAGTVVGVPQNPAQLATGSIYRGLANPFLLRSLRQTGTFGASYALKKDVTIDGNISSFKREGHQPWGASFAFVNANEVPLAVNSRTNEARAGLEWTKPRGMFRLAYWGSFYDNHIKQLVWDNPSRATDTNPFDASAFSNGNGPARGRMSVPPSNTLNSITGITLYKIRPRTVVNGAATFTQMNQNDPLIPWTINPVINSPAVFAQFPNLASVPRATAQAKVNGVNAVINFSSREHRKVYFDAHYRYNDHVNRTPLFDGTQFVVTDGNPTNIGAVSEHFNIQENYADLSTTLNVIHYTALRVGYTYDAFDRTGRSFSNMTDHTIYTSADVIGNRWVTMRALYAFTARKGSGFSEDALEEGGFQPGLRFYDEADRDRHRGTLLFTVNPTDVMDVTFSLVAGNDRYHGPGHDFGLLDNNNEAYNAGINFYPADTVSFGANYGREHFASNQKSRQASPLPSPQFADPTRDWTLKNTENENNVDLYLDLPKLASKTSARLTWDFSNADNGFLFDGPRVASLAAANTFIPLPDVTNNWNRIAADVQHFFVPKVGVGVDYWFERFRTVDFNTVDLPGQAGAPRIDYLGEINTGYGSRPYTGHTAFVRLLYLF